MLLRGAETIKMVLIHKFGHVTPTTPTRISGSVQKHFLPRVNGKLKLCSKFGEDRSKILSIDAAHWTDTRKPGSFIFCTMLYIALHGHLMRGPA